MLVHALPAKELLGRTENAILLPDVDASGDYRLGEERDLSDPQVEQTGQRRPSSVSCKI